MNKQIKLFLMLLLLISCNERKNDPKYNRVVHQDLCIKACRENFFKTFHNDNTFSSGSLSGLGQASTIDKVVSLCKEELKGSKCCGTEDKYLPDTAIDISKPSYYINIIGFKYIGYCKKEIK